jgi:SAM-dependent methyltransferase
MQDRRSRMKSRVRKYPALARAMQWIFDPAFTPGYEITRWVHRRPGMILNFGSGSRNFGKRVVNLDVEPSSNVNVVNRSPGVPFRSEVFDGVLLEYVLEHVDDYKGILLEVSRVLKPGGSLLATVPFRQNYHACPQDFWRFTHEGLERVFTEAGFTEVHVHVYGGPVSAWIDATKEFLATLLSVGIPVLYDILSQLLIIPFIPLRYLDVLLRHLPTAKYTAFSFLVTAMKSGESIPGKDVSLQEIIWAPATYQMSRKGNVFWIEHA